MTVEANTISDLDTETLEALNFCNATLYVTAKHLLEKRNESLVKEMAAIGLKISQILKQNNFYSNERKYKFQRVSHE